MSLLSSMNFFAQAAGVSSDKVQTARAVLAKLMRAELDAITVDMIDRTLPLPGYEKVTREQVVPNCTRAMQMLLQTLEGGSENTFAVSIRGIAYQRATQGLPIHAISNILDLTELMLGELGQRIEDRELRLAALVYARLVCDEARAIIVSAFQQAMEESRAAINRLVSQFSAPLLPVLPGVLLLPLVGAIGEARSQQIVETVLHGIGDTGAHTAIFDITGLTDVDVHLAGYITRLAAAARLLGAKVVLVGVKAQVAKALVEGGAELSHLTIFSNLASALLAASRNRPS